MGNFLAAAVIDPESDFTTAETTTLQCAGINVQGWRKTQEDFLLHRLDMTRKLYKSPKVLQREYHQLAAEIEKQEEQLEDAGILERSAGSEEEYSDSDSTVQAQPMPREAPVLDEKSQLMLQEIAMKKGR
jgi:hypothetical protein